MWKVIDKIKSIVLRKAKLCWEVLNKYLNVVSMCYCFTTLTWNIKGVKKIIQNLFKSSTVNVMYVFDIYGRLFSRTNLCKYYSREWKCLASQCSFKASFSTAQVQCFHWCKNDLTHKVSVFQENFVRFLIGVTFLIDLYM